MSNLYSGDGGSKVKMKLAVFATTIALSGAAVLAPWSAIAESTEDLIAQLQAQIAALQEQLNALLAQTGQAPGGTGTVQCTFTRDLSVGSQGEDVRCLQRYLNSAGFTLASSGPGSPGNETTYFGPLTRSAVVKWQEAYAANVLAPLGLSAGTGYWGPSSRSYYSTLLAQATTTPPPTIPPIGTVTPTPSPTTTPVGSGLTVSSTTQPPAQLVVQNAARVPFVKAVLTASPDGDVTVNSITVERQGVGSDGAFSGILLLDENGDKIGLTKTLNAQHRAVLNQPFTVKAGTSKTITIAADMEDDLTNYSGELPSLAIVAVDAGSTPVSGSLPIVGNQMTVNSTLTIGSLASPARGTLDPGASRTNLEVGTTNFYAAAVRFTAGSAEPVVIEKIRWYQAGSAASGDLENVKVVVDGTEYDTTLTSDGKYYVADFGDGVEVGEGDTVELAIKTDVVSGSARTIDFDIRKKTDIVARGKTYGYYITPGGGSSGSAAEGAFSSDTEPYYNAYDHTISKGSIRVEKSSSVPAGNVAVDSVEALGGFDITVQGEPVQISSFTLNFYFTGTGTSSDITNVALYDSNGNIVAGPNDPSSGVVTWTDTWTVPVGTHTYTVKGKLDTTFVNNDTVQVAVNPGSKITARGETTGDTITPSPSSEVRANTQTVKAASLKVSVSTSPAAQNVVRGVNGFLFTKLQYDATDSGEDIRITSQELTIVTSAVTDADHLNTCQMFDGSTALNTGANVVNPSGNALGADPEVTFTLDNNLIIPKGTVKVVDVKCNISTLPDADDTFSIGLTAGNDTNATGKDTGVTVTESVTTSNGQTMTIKTSGVLTITKDVSSPSESLAIAGKTDVTLGVLKLRADYEPIRLDRIALTLSSSTASTSDLTKVTLWDGATKVGEAVFAGNSTRATSTLTADFIIPKDSTKLLTIKADLAPLGINQPATRGHLLAVNYDGEATTTTRGIGQDSGSEIRPAQGADTDATGVRIVKTIPTLERLGVPSNTLANGEMVLYRFKVTADPAGDVGLAKVAFRVSSTTVATTSVFKLYAYTDSNFSSQAYAKNPVHSRNVDVVGEDVWDNGVSTGTIEKIDFYFNPVTYTNAGAGEMTYEALNIPAGETRYFELRGTVSRAESGDSISVALLGDSAVATNTNLVNRETANTVAGTSNGDFVWSPNTTTTAPTSTNDWLNGYLVPGLPGTEMTQQTFSK